MEQTLRVCVYGATGYTGIELIRLLKKHPYVKIVSLVSQSYKGKKVNEVLPFLELNLKFEDEPTEDFDVAFLCLPHEASLEIAPKLLNQGKHVIDLSAAYRIKNHKAYVDYYGFQHTHLDILQMAVYGLPELFREDISKAKLVANPGCYPTATLIGIYPPLKEGLKIKKVFVEGISGVSGAGRKTDQKFHFPEMTENAFAYSVEKHRHTPEMEDILKRISGQDIFVRFTPKVVPMSRGLICTILFECEKMDLFELYMETYKDEPFVKVTKGELMTKYVIGTNKCLVYPFYDERLETAVIVSVIDNLGKGASGQAIQNMNIMFHLEEKTSLEDTPLFP